MPYEFIFNTFVTINLFNNLPILYKYRKQNLIIFVNYSITNILQLTKCLK